MGEIVDRIRDHCGRHDLLPRRGPVLAMVSGGADSMCLMHLLSQLHDGPLHVLTIDHGLRRSSRAEVAAVADAADRLGLACHVERLALEAGPGLQQRARDVRRDVAQRVADHAGATVIATGHTASDQAETVLFRLARGTGRTGAVGMAPRAGAWIRPLLGVARSETRAWCRENGVPVVDDPSNDDPAFARARVRNGLVPALAAVHPGAERHVAAFADRLRDEDVLLRALIDEAFARCARGPGVDAVALRGEVAPLRALIVRRLIETADLPGEAGAAATVARIVDLACTGGVCEVPGGLAAVDRGVLVVERSPARPPHETELPVPGTVRFGGHLVSARRDVAEPPRPDRVAVVADGPLRVRPSRDGDRIALAGGGRQAVGRLLAASGVPARHRGTVPVVVCGDDLLWVAGHRAAPERLAPPGSPSLVLTLERP